MRSSEMRKVYAKASTFLLEPTSLAKDTFARNEQGGNLPIVNADSFQKASALCARGAISRALYECGHADWMPNGDTERLVSCRMALELGVWSLGKWSDEASHSEVLAGFLKMAA